MATNHEIRSKAKIFKPVVALLIGAALAVSIKPISIALQKKIKKESFYEKYEKFLKGAFAGSFFSFIFSFPIQWHQENFQTKMQQQSQGEQSIVTCRADRLNRMNSLQGYASIYQEKQMRLIQFRQGEVAPTYVHDKQYYKNKEAILRARDEARSNFYAELKRLSNYFSPAIEKEANDFYQWDFSFINKDLTKDNPSAEFQRRLAQLNKHLNEERMRQPYC